MLNFLMSLLIPDGYIKGSRFYNAIIRLLADYIIPMWFRFSKRSVHLSKDKNNDANQVIISLTSFGGRVNKLHLCLESLFRQSKSPDKIILWLSEDEYDDNSLPASLREFIDVGLEVHFCEDLRSHKKYFGTLKLWPNAIIITVDDDVFYPENMLEKLLDNYIKFPNYISCYRAHLIKSNDYGIMPYLNWGFASPGKKKPSHELMAVGVGGILYPPKSLHKDVLNDVLFKELCYFADDIWLKIMAYKAGTKIVKVRAYSKTLFSISKEQGYTLSEENVLGGRNDSQLKSLLEHYGMTGNEFNKAS